MVLLKIGDTELPNPIAGSYQITTQDGDADYEVTESYTHMRERIRADIYTISCRWAVDGAELATIITAIAPASFDMTFFDMLTCDFVTKTFYVTSKKGNLISLSPTIVKSVWELELTFEEM